MATEGEVIDVLSDLVGAFNYAPKDLDGMIRTYSAMLADIPADLLSKAAEVIIKNDEWFPKVSRLRGAAKIVSENNGAVPGDAFALDVNEWDVFRRNARRELRSLERAFWERGELIPAQYEKLAQGCDIQGLENMAAFVRERLARLRSIERSETVPEAEAGG